MIEIKIEGRRDGTTANATIAVDLDPNMKEWHERYNFEFSVDSLDTNKSTFWYKCEPLFNIKHSNTDSPLYKTEELNLYDRNHEGKTTRLVETRMSGTTILPDSKFSKKLGNLNRIKGYKIKRNSYSEYPFNNGKRFKCVHTNNNNPFLKDVEFKLLPDISSEVIPSKYEGVNHQLITVDRNIVAEVENHEIVGLKFPFPKIGSNIEVSHSGNDAFGSTVVEKNGRIEAIQQSKQIGYITTDGVGGVLYKTLAKDEYEYSISESAKKLTESIIKHDEEMKNAMQRAVNVTGFDVGVYYIKGDTGVKHTKQYFYFTDHSTIWALYRYDMKFDKKLNDYIPQPLKIEYENLKEYGADHYSYKRTYFNRYGEHTYSQIVEDRSDSDCSRYLIETEDFKVFCKTVLEEDGKNEKYIVRITRRTGGSGYLSSLIKRFDTIYTHDSNDYIKAIESLIEYDHPGDIEPVGIYRYLKMIEDVCKNPHDAMRHSWSNTFVDTENTLDIVDIDLILNPGDTISWAKIMLWAEERYKSESAYEELTLLDRIVWEDFMLPSSMEYDKYAGAYHSDITTDKKSEEENDKVDVDEDEIPTASNACEAMYMDD